MRLREIVDRINNNIQWLEPPSERFVAQDGNSRVRVLRRHKLQDALKELARIPGVAPHASKILEDPTFSEPGDPVVVFPNIWDALNLKLSNLRALLLALMAMVRSVIPKESPLAIHVKLPELTSIDELEDFLNDIKVSIAHPVALIEKESVGFAGFDVGSSYVTILAASDAALIFIAVLLHHTHLYLQERSRRAQMVLMMRESHIPANLIDGVSMDNDARLMEKANELAVAAIEMAGGAKLSAQEKNEGANAVSAAIQRLASLQERGAEFLPSATASEETRQLVPDRSSVRQLVAAATDKAPRQMK
ncbi:hypothetical protein [Sorangium sp. So ce362]|uniref:hypothetical protein n=1 Tax=Sorangium sp. So ce362 TaxID=3133303 RepID=UPI003F62FA92